jgi:hypothetical protein
MVNAEIKAVKDKNEERIRLTVTEDQRKAL